LTFLQSVVLGVVQGLTEFLPISSDGHLAVFRHLLKVPAEGAQALALDVALHAGTFCSLLLFFRQDLTRLFQGVFSREATLLRAEERRRMGLIIVATVATALVAFPLKDSVEVCNTFLPAAGVGFLMTTLFLMLGEWGGQDRQRLGVMEAPWMDALILGLVQGLAVWPGLSRSGSTLGLALLLRWRWDEAGRFCFLMALPAVGGALLLEAKDMAGLPHMGAVLAGVVVSFLTGLLALNILMRFLAARRLWPFALYTVLLAMYTLLK
jgi:undecaprenyl-diphosphatase